MEINLEKQNVMFTEKVREESLEQPIDSEIMLPDFCSDIARVLKCRAQGKIVSKRIANGVLNIDGNVVLTVLYVDDGGDIKSFEQMLTYYRELETGDEENIDADIQCKVEYANCRVINPRKLEIHGALTLAVRITARRQAEIVTAVSGGGIQLNCKNQTISSVIDRCEKYITVNDEIELTGEAKSVRSILHSEASVSDCECKIVTGKAMVKADLCVKIVYCTDVKMRLETLETRIPFTQMLDLPETDEACACAAFCDVTAVELHPRTGIDGEVKTISLSAGVTICATSQKEINLVAADDAYSVEYEIALTRSQHKFRRCVAEIDENYLCKKEIDLPRETAALLDLWSDVTLHGVKNENGELTFQGTLLMSILAADPDGMPLYFEKAVDFSYQYRLESPGMQVECIPKLSVGNCRYSLSSGTSAEVKIELLIRAEVYESAEMQVISDIALASEDKKAGENQPALTVYYAHSRETVFEIARRYNTTVAAVKSANSLDCDRLESDAMLLIPAAN